MEFSNFIVIKDKCRSFLEHSVVYVIRQDDGIARNGRRRRKVVLPERVRPQSPVRDSYFTNDVLIYIGKGKTDQSVIRHFSDHIPSAVKSAITRLKNGWRSQPCFALGQSAGKVKTIKGKLVAK